MTQHAQVDEDFKPTAAMFADRRSDENKASYSTQQQMQVRMLLLVVENSLTKLTKCYANYGRKGVSIKIDARKPNWLSKKCKADVERIIVERGYEVNRTLSSFIIKMPRNKIPSVDLCP